MSYEIRPDRLYNGLEPVNHRFLAGKALIVESCDIFGFTTNGIDISLGASAAASIQDTTIVNVGQVGIRATTTSGAVQVSVYHVRVEYASVGVEAADHSRISVRESVLDLMGTGAQADLRLDSNA